VSRFAICGSTSRPVLRSTEILNRGAGALRPSARCASRGPLRDQGTSEGLRAPAHGIQQRRLYIFLGHQAGAQLGDGAGPSAEPVVSHRWIATDLRRNRAPRRRLRRATISSVTSTAPLQFLVLLVTSWLDRSQGEAIEYLRAENRVLRARLGPARIRLADAERRLLAEKGKPLGGTRLAEVATLATPATLLRNCLPQRT